MSTWKRFWISTLGWSAALAALLIAYSLAVYAGDDGFRGPGAVVLSLHGVARSIGLLFPLVVFFAAVTIPPSTDRGSPTSAAVMTGPVGAGLLVYLWLAYVEPWWQVAVFNWTTRLEGITLDPAPVASTQRWLAAQMTSPALSPAEARFFAWLFHLPNAIGLLTSLLGIAGIIISLRRPTVTQRWTIAALIAVTVAPMLLGSLRLSLNYSVPPQATTYGMLLMPIFLLALLGWIHWTERGRAPIATGS